MVYRRSYPKKIVPKNPNNGLAQNQANQVQRSSKTDQPQRVVRSGKSDQPQRSNVAAKGDKKPVGVKKVASATTPAAVPKKAAVAPKLSPLGRNAFDIGKATTVPKPKARPSAAPPKPTARPSMSKGSSSPPAYAIPKAKPQLGGKVSSGFQGNWAGAAATDMQKRGGARINRGGGLLGLLRKK